MKTKEYFQQIKNCDEKIKAKLRERAEIRDMLTSISVATNFEPVKHSTSGDRMGNAIAKLVDLENELNDDIDRFVDLKREIENVFDDLDPVLALVLRNRYVYYMTWEQIAVETGYSYRHVTRLHGKALVEATKVMETWKKDGLECPTDHVL